jgi:hypothetical protein
MSDRANDEQAIGAAAAAGRGDGGTRERQAARAREGHVRRLDVTPALRLDLTRIMPAVERAVDEFIADREAADLPVPDRQAMLDRATAILANVNPNLPGGTNSLAANRRITLHHRDVPPYFGMGTEG